MFQWYWEATGSYTHWSYACNGDAWTRLCGWYGVGDTIDRQTDRLRAIGRVCCRVLALCWETRAVTHIGFAYVTAMQGSGCVVGIGTPPARDYGTVAGGRKHCVRKWIAIWVVQVAAHEHRAL